LRYELFLEKNVQRLRCLDIDEEESLPDELAKGSISYREVVR
jgi:hypothetical protein